LAAPSRDDGKAHTLSADTVAGFQRARFYRGNGHLGAREHGLRVRRFRGQILAHGARNLDSVAAPLRIQDAGMDALQQRVTLKLVEKQRKHGGLVFAAAALSTRNHRPYASKGETAERTAFKICRDLFYRELKAFPAFYAKDPERAKTFLPNNVRYDAAYFGIGPSLQLWRGRDRTNLNALEIADEPLAAESMPSPDAAKSPTPRDRSGIARGLLK